uniref:Nerve growth factor receptor b n=1 Tax=Cyprinus carpio TaxID=7962 RepID=A0A8C1LCZ6_CYPCA
MCILCFSAMLAVGEVLSTQDSCPSGSYTTSGECCKQCQPGEGVVTPCGATQTVCEPCLDSETFSENFSHTEQCQPCTPCSELMRMLTPCTDANDAVCVCDYGFFFSKMTGRCEICTVCPVGQGVLIRCNFDHDTMCEECVDDTYSDQETSFDPCMPCSVCDQPEMELRSCTPFSDAVCQGRRIENRNQTEAVNRWQRNCPVYDNSIFTFAINMVYVDTSCVPIKQTSTTITTNKKFILFVLVVKIDGGSGLSLPLHTREEVEKLLNRTCEGEESGANEDTDWCSLAGLLGYKEEHIANFKQEERPIQALLSHWASQDSANIDSLCTALKKINREDIAQSITVKPTATSTV